MLKRVILISLMILGEYFSSYSQQAEKVAVLWCDPLLNIRDIHSKSGIINLLEKANNSGIGAIALGIKSLSGEVIYDSNIAPRLLEWRKFRVPFDFDPIKIFLEEGRIRNIQIYAVFSVFSEGHFAERKGTVYNDHPEWQSEVYVIEDEKPTVLPITQWAYGTTAFANPLLKEVQDYEISIIKEFAQKYSVDSIVLDKVRFSGIESDFSEYSKAKFEDSLGSGRTLQYWPEDVYELKNKNDVWEIEPGLYFQDWIEFRSKSIHSFIKRLVGEIETIDPTLPIGNFVGAWYPTYYEYGVNWASESNLPEKEWASRDYFTTAIAELLDYLVVGCYFPRIKMEEAEKIGAEWWMSVEGSALLAMEVVNNVCPLYGSVLVELFNKGSEEFKEALITAQNQTNGLYIYDLSYIERNNYWDELTEVLQSDAGK